MYIRECSCGNTEHTEIIGKNEIGTWVNCECGSTMLFTVDNSDEEC